MSAPLDATAQERVVAAAAAGAAVLPAVDPLTASVAQVASEHVTAAFAGAAVADLTGGLTGRVAVLVGKDLVDALAASPLGGLDLAAATQPALDAVAAELGGSAGPARSIELALALDALGQPATAVPLIGGTIAAAILVTDETLAPVTIAPATGQGFNQDETYVAQPVVQQVDQPALRPEPVPAGVGAGPQPGAGAHGAPTAYATPMGSAPIPLPAQRGIEMLHGVAMDVTVELGRARMSVRELLALTPGTVLELDRAAGSPADLLVNGRLIARGEVVVVDEDFGLRITEIVDGSSAD